MATLRAVITQIINTANISLDPTNYSRVKAMFFEEYTILARREIDNYGFNPRYLQVLDMNTTFILKSNLPNSLRSFLIPSATGMFRSANLIPAIINHKSADFVRIVDQNGLSFVVMSEAANSYKYADRFIANIHPVISRNNYLWFPDKNDPLETTFVASLTASWANPIEILQIETDNGLLIEDDMEIPIATNIISAIKLMVLQNDFGLITSRMAQQQLAQAQQAAQLGMKG